LKTILEEEISEKNCKGRVRMEYIGEIMKGVKTKSYALMKEIAENGIDWITATIQWLD
jgi:hypothetical protein